MPDQPRCQFQIIRGPTNSVFDAPAQARHSARPDIPGLRTGQRAIWNDGQIAPEAEGAMLRGRAVQPPFDFQLKLLHAPIVVPVNHLLAGIKGILVADPFPQV